LTLGEIERVAQAALTASHSTGQSVHDFVLLMSFSGGRLSETLRLRWADVDLIRGQLRFGSDGLSKNGEMRTVDFNDRLKNLLEDMAKRRVPDSDFLFPGRWRSESKDMPALSFSTTLRAARSAAGVPDFRPHSCRHFFASMALMSKVDLQTVAAWLGHRDHGVLLSRVYSHLLNEHKAEQAKLVSFGPTLLESKNAVNL
jgi:integrase